MATTKNNWVEETPRSCDYSLTMFGSDGDTLENLYLSRKEYRELKKKLAKRRGLLPEQSAAREIAEEYRGAQRSGLMLKFKCFMESATPEEVIFLERVLANHEMNFCEDRLMTLMGAINITMTGEDWCDYLKVPEKHYRAVKAFVDTLSTEQPDTAAGARNEPVNA